ncbi:MAG: multiheme c-type cytochrome [Planctomycetota bacterium]|nr:multiheme c-type cytochrome [Planctomycetota bacterium]MDP6763275.1 multiheme c-type cytochrome [Planctomycetota bacterium]MDP6988043.1 multiheme c-type cytochrome [Planctomycetota bacterium]
MEERPTANSRKAVALACATGLLLASASWSGVRADDDDDASAPAPVQATDDGVPAVLEGWREHECAGCHEAISEEWAGSRHALAWVDPHFQEALQGLRRPKSCHGCHIPLPLHVGRMRQKPRPRATDLHHGVDCITCHAGPDETILGPWGEPTDAHPSVLNESFTPEGQSRVCIACHATNIGPVLGIAKDFVRTEQAAKGESCVGCHMEAVERPAAVDPQTGEASPTRPGRSHALKTPRDPVFLRSAFDLRLSPGDSGVILSIANRCGHRVPGLEGRTLTLTAEAFDGAGTPLERREITIDKEDHLGADESLDLVLPAATERVRIRGLHDAPGFAEPVEFVDEELGL